ncbi:ABC transporter substrate-binding protein [Streptomyces sp. NPDC020917]|uniref:ABC transporter substrate-binding protein n=1 Tax=Streptomyces sp. NPDC020917 TaxID=3365102 RepID=UPI00378F7A7D
MAMVSPTAGQAYNFSPGYSDYDSLLVRPVYEFVIRWKQGPDGQMGFGPGVASEWTFAPDLSKVTLKIRDGATFTDGTPLDANAVAGNVNFWIRHNIAINWGRFASGAKVVDGAVQIAVTPEGAAQGANQIQIYLATTPVMSPKALKAPDKLAADPVGSGPYELDTSASTPGTEYRFVRNKGYGDAEEFPYDSIVMKVYPDTVAAVNALRSGQVDFAPVDEDTAPQVSSAGFKVLETPGQVRGLMLGDKSGAISPALADVRVRQAMNMAFDRKMIAKNLDQGYATPTLQPWIKGFPQYDKSLESLYPYDVARARKLLADAGYPNGFDLVLPAYSDQPALTKYDPIIKQSLGDIGIRVTYKTTDWYTAVTEPKFAATNNYIASYLAQQFYVAHKGLFNPWNYDDPTMTELVNAFNVSPERERADIARKIGRRTAETAWMLILTAPYSLYAMDKSVEVTANLPLASAPELRFLRPTGR